MKRQATILCPIAESVSPVTFQSVLSMVIYSQQHGIELREVGTTSRQLIDGARNNLLEAFLGTNTEWAFWIDSDMTFAPDTLVRLFNTAEKTNSKLVTGIYHQRKPPFYPAIWSRDVPLESGEMAGRGTVRSDTNKYVGSFTFPDPKRVEPFPVHAAGFGCVLMHRSVAEVMPRPWFKMLPGQCSEDFYFFVEAKDCGFELWADPTIALGHIGDPPIITRDDFHKEREKLNITVDAIKFPHEAA